MTIQGFHEDASPALIASVIDDAGILASLLGITPARASAIIAPFGSLAETISAPIDRLIETGVRKPLAARIKMLHAALSRVLYGEIRRRPALSSWHAVIEYVRVTQAFEPIEHFRVLFLDKRNNLIASEVQQTGTVDHTPIYPREVIKRALALDATAVVLVHNHPSGDPTPSRADIDMTKALIDIAKPLGILVHDHIIVGRDGHASLRGLSLI